jgi:hypothetical protein
VLSLPASSAGPRASVGSPARHRRSAPACG